VSENDHFRVRSANSFTASECLVELRILSHGGRSARHDVAKFLPQQVGILAAAELVKCSIMLILMLFLDGFKKR